MHGKRKVRGILHTFSEFPLFKGTFLHMQLINIELVDRYLEQLEADLLNEYDQRESTPLPQAMFVSAISQMWIFAFYEFLRTWKQWVDELIQYGEQLNALDKSQEGIKKRELYIQNQKTSMDRSTRLGILSDPFYSQSFRDVENKVAI
jgi:hypothetical protein